MKQILFAALIVMGFIACNDNPDNTTNSGDTTPDSAYNNPTATDTGQGMQSSGSGTGTGVGSGNSGRADSISSKSGGAGQATGSGSQASQDTGTRRP